ncbi:MAG TPA: hypothetical protein VFY19_04090 [Geminicoccaceae bacterium]|nr:hypothetical protein [Geminicoccaceae bacterium]
MSRARQSSSSSATEDHSRPPALAEVGAWQLADGVLFSVLSSLVLWSIIITSLYHALS